MSYDYDRLASTADRLLAKFGRDVTVSTTAASGVTTRTAKAVTIGVVKHDLGDSGVSIGDHRLLIEASANPLPGDRITDAQGTRIVVDPVNPIRPAETTIAHECYTRLG